MKFLIRFITHGGEDYMTTRWHRVKCKVRFKWHMVIKGRILDWWNRETYVPLFCRMRSEMRAVRYSGASEAVSSGNFMLPLSILFAGDLPHFTTSDACFAYISKTWPHLSP